MYFLGGIQVVPVKIDLEGMIPTGPGSLEDVLENWDDSKGRRPHMMYTITYVFSCLSYCYQYSPYKIALVRIPPAVLCLFQDAKNFTPSAVNMM